MPEAAFSPTSIRRPRLLIRAARHGLSDYNRARTLAKLLPECDVVPGLETMNALAAREALLEHTRVQDRAHYSVATHVEVLIALLAEWQAWRAISAGAGAA